MAVNIRFTLLGRFINKMARHRYWVASIFIVGIVMGLYQGRTNAAAQLVEPVKACVIAREIPLNDLTRYHIARCLNWHDDALSPICQGYYQILPITPLNTDEVHIKADEVSFYNQGRSRLTGNVEIRQKERIVNAQTASVFRDAKTNKVTKIELLGEVHYLEGDELMIAKRAIINPQNKAGRVEEVLYRFNSKRHVALLPAWGRASLIERLANKDYLLRGATYTNCAPQDKAWQIEADSIHLDHAEEKGVARNAILRIGDWPVAYSPYFSFPTSKKRKSGFLMPTMGTTNVGGFDYALPYYWNIAPNYDATFIPHYYSRRGLMVGGQFRYLTLNSTGIFNGHFLGNDRAFKQFLQEKQPAYPWLSGLSTDRWSVDFHNSTFFYPNLHLGIDFQQLSDDYFLQDFSSNMAVMTVRQLLRQGNLTYTTPHWLFRAMVESYQTLNPINETPILDIYRRQPQLLAQGIYDDLPFNANFAVLGQYDQFRMPKNVLFKQQGPRYHLNPILSLPQIKSWGYITPAVELVENYYQVSNTWYPFLWQVNPYPDRWPESFNRTIPRYYVDSGLFLERPLPFRGQAQTLEPRFFYLKVPYHDQDPIPVYDSAYMIFNVDQLFRTNRFSGFDRIGDTDQFSYALTSRWLSAQGSEKASITVGQIRYFSDRKVQLCQTPTGDCIDNPLTLGYLSPLSRFSPVASRGTYHFDPALTLIGDYVWDPATHSTNNGHLAFHYQPAANKILNLGYTYLVNGDVTKVAYSYLENNPLHQATISYAWPMSERWSSLGTYSYNISKRYEMASFLGVQYDSCCWGVRLLGGRSFQSLNTQLQPQYNNNVYLQIILKGLGSAGNSDPSSIIHTYLPTYYDEFRH